VGFSSVFTLVLSCISGQQLVGYRLMCLVVSVVLLCLLLSVCIGGVSLLGLGAKVVGCREEAIEAQRAESGGGFLEMGQPCSPSPPGYGSGGAL